MQFDEVFVEGLRSLIESQRFQNQLWVETGGDVGDRIHLTLPLSVADDMVRCLELYFREREDE